MVYSDGECSTEFEIRAVQSGGNATPDGNAESPKTGDSNYLMLWLPVLFVSGGVVTAVAVRSKKRRTSAK